MVLWAGFAFGLLTI